MSERAQLIQDIERARLLVEIRSMRSQDGPTKQEPQFGDPEFSSRAAAAEHMRAQMPMLGPARAEANMERLEPIGRAIHEQAPAIGATIATMPFGGAGGPAVQGGKFLIPSLGRALLNLAKKPATVAFNAARAAAGGGAGSVATGGTIDDAIKASIEQGIADPISRMTMGLAKVVLRPAGRLLPEARRMIEFARKEGLQVDPSAATDKILPDVIGNFAKGFIGSRKFAQKKLRAIANHISADPANVDAMFRKVLDGFDPSNMGPVRDRVAAALARVGAKDVGAIFASPAAASAARKGMTAREFRDAQMVWVSDAVEKSAVSVPRVGRVIDGNVLMEQVTALRQAAGKHLPEHVIDRLENLAAYAKAHGATAAESVEPLITAPKQAITAAVVGGAGLVLDPLTVGTSATSAAIALTSQIFNPRSVLGRWLTTGLIPDLPGLAGKGAEAAISATLRSNVGQEVGEMR